MLHIYLVEFVPVPMRGMQMPTNEQIVAKLHDVAVYYTALGPAAVRAFLSAMGDAMLVMYQASVASEDPPKVMLTVVLSNAIPESAMGLFMKTILDVSLNGEVLMDGYAVDAVNASVIHMESPL